MESELCGTKRERPDDDVTEDVKRPCMEVSVKPRPFACNCLSNIDPDAFKEELENFSFRIPQFDGVFCMINATKSSSIRDFCIIIESNALRFIRTLERLEKFAQGRINDCGKKKTTSVNFVSRETCVSWFEYTRYIWFLDRDIEHQITCFRGTDLSNEPTIHLTTEYISDNVAQNPKPIDDYYSTTYGHVQFRCDRMLNGSVDSAEEVPETVSFLFELYERYWDCDDGVSLFDNESNHITLAPKSRDTLCTFIAYTLAEKFPKSRFFTSQSLVDREASNLYEYEAILGERIMKPIISRVSST